MPLPAPSIVILTGVSASGKSSVAEALAKRQKRGVHLRGDNFRKMIVSGREAMTQSASEEALRQLELRYEIAHSAAKSYADAGFAVIYQDVILGAYLAQAAERLRRHATYVVVLNPLVTTIETREAGRPKSAYGAGWSARDMVSLLHEQTLRLGLWLDTSALSVEQTADAIEARLAEAKIA